MEFFLSFIFFIKIRVLQRPQDLAGTIDLRLQLNEIKMRICCRRTVWTFRPARSVIHGKILFFAELSRNLWIKSSTMQYNVIRLFQSWHFSVLLYVLIQILQRMPFFVNLSKTRNLTYYSFKNLSILQVWVLVFSS